MKLVLDYNVAPDQQRKAWLENDQVLQIGSTGRADVVVESDPLMADVHFAITGLDGCWHVAAFPGKSPVYVNGQPVDYSPLKNGDTILAGGTEFYVSIDGGAIAALEQPIIATPVPQQKSETRPVSFSVHRYPSRVVELSIANADRGLCDLLNRFEIEGHWYCALNAVRSRRVPNFLLPTGNDLLRDAPEEIRATDSLEIVPITKPFSMDGVDELLEVFRADAGCLIVSNLHLPDLLESHRFVWAWYTRPGNLYRQLTEGSRDLALHLLGEIDVVITLSRLADSGTTILTSSDRSDRVCKSIENIRLASTSPDQVGF